jgi:hypothetical protein
MEIISDLFMIKDEPGQKSRGFVGDKEFVWGWGWLEGSIFILFVKIMRGPKYVLKIVIFWPKKAKIFI